MLNRLHLLAFCLLVVPTATLAADPPPLSLESTVLLGLTKNPAIQAELEKVKQAGFAIQEARSNYYPQVTANIKGGHEYDNPASEPAGVFPSGKVTSQSNSTDMTLVVNQILYNGFATDEEVYRRKDLKQSAEFESMVTLETTIANTITSYVDVWHFQRNVAESEAFVAQLEKIGNKVKLMSEAGAESKAKKEYVDSRVANAQTELHAAKASLTDALSNLETITGSLPPFRAVRPEQLDPTVRSIEAYYHLAEKDNNHLLLNASDHSAVEHQIEEAHAAYLPTVNFELDGDHGYDVGGHIGNTWHGSAMFVMNYKLFDGFSRDAGLGRLQSQKAENEYRQVSIMRDLEKDIRKSYNEILATKDDLGSNMKEILSSETLQGLYTKQFELGEGDIINMIEGFERLHAAKLKSYKLEASIVVDSYTLLQKAGALRKEGFCASC
jgi:adhesin transport system outer membrane protein